MGSQNHNKMKKILYLHGLESGQGGQKVDYLATKGLVYAPEMPYREDEDLFNEMVQLVKKMKPDIIIGSSMGGYFAERLASHCGSQVLLFNPASVNDLKYVDEYGIVTRVGSREIPSGRVVLGENDEVILPVQSKRYFEYYQPQLEIVDEYIGHRTPMDVFVKHVDELVC